MMAPLKLDLEDTQKKLVDAIFTADNTLKAQRTKLNRLRDTLNSTWTKAQRSVIVENPGEAIELDGFHHAIILSEEEKTSTADTEHIVAALTKKQLPEVISITLQKLEEKFPKVYEKAIKKEPSGSRRIFFLGDKAENDSGH